MDRMDLVLLGLGGCSVSATGRERWLRGPGRRMPLLVTRGTWQVPPSVLQPDCMATRSPVGAKVRHGGTWPYQPGALVDVHARRR